MPQKALETLPAPALPNATAAGEQTSCFAERGADDEGGPVPGLEISSILLSNAEELGTRPQRPAEYQVPLPLPC